MNDTNPAQPQLKMLRVYLKDASLEAPNSPLIFNEQGQPGINVQLSSSSSQVAEDVYEVVLTLTVTAKLEEKTAYLAEVHQAGLFGIRGFPDEQLEAILGAFGPGNLFPFAREAVAGLVAKGGFPPLLIDPINFDALFLQRKQQLQARQAAQPSPTEH